MRPERQNGQWVGVAVSPDEAASLDKSHPGGGGALEAVEASASRPRGLAALSQQQPPVMPQPLGPQTGLARLQPPPPSSFTTTVPLGSHERDRMQQDNTADADAWWRDRRNY